MRKKEKDWKLKYEANIKYDSENTIRIGCKFNRSTDSEIVEALEGVTSKQGFVKEAIRFYLAHKDEFTEE